MIAYLPDLAAPFVLMWRRTTEHRDVQVWVDEDTTGWSAELTRLVGPAPERQTAQDGGAPSTSFQPRHFRILRWIGIECRLEAEARHVDPGHPRRRGQRT